ncbi:Flp pilus assembly protein CpaB [Vibrio sp. UCD-FRSSP16_10]|uniref:RcpC/CpaB family pilus assembly protein n=1 Tax=unclassified Vibrio TaxID=2614977 RepID=UPI0007FBEE8C|nr:MULTISPECIES: RcpC/CpaB family pilus assembly protein [unclassified Vibrio]OBT15844.1 Flp pilus assembly protein CpaB [Vibrio sp. UCD-FRSSP16_10]OBT17738.1 Flp pilus assembly protein CpaB [Vibrio sp. UCD-FRSSP16_30]
MNTRIIFVFSFTIVSIALFILFQNVNARAQNKVHKEYESQKEQIKEVSFVLWKAKKELERGEKVTKTDFVRIVVPQEQALSLGVDGDVLLPLESDALINRKIDKGEWVYSEFISNPNDSGYLDLLASEGMILYPLPISTINLINNYIRPGDRIDIISVSSPLTNLADTGARITQFRGVKARTIKRNVKVLAFEQKPVDSKEQTPQSSNSLSPRVSAAGDSKTTVVIEIEPEFVSRLSLAQRTMHLEIYRSQTSGEITPANMSDVIENYQGIRELRGAETQTTNPEVY